MNNTILIISILFCSIPLISQNNNLYVEYEVIYNTSSPRIKKSILKTEGNIKAEYIEFPEYKLLKSSELKEPSETTKTVNYNTKGTIRRIKTNLVEKKISSIETIIFDKIIYNVIEGLPKIKWNTNYTETKLIGKFNCFKATSSFRGRNYIIWYAEKIPIGFGLWKLFGAPGLILEAYDDTFTYKWIVKKITQENKEFEQKIKNLNYDKEINLKDFVDKKYVNPISAKSLENKITSKLPRGVNLKVKKNPNRQGKELIFEWEKETTQN